MRFQHISTKLPKRHISKNRSLTLLLSSLVGIIAGLVAWILKNSISAISDLITSLIKDNYPTQLFILVPPLGILIVIYLSRYVIKRNVTHGVRVIKKLLRIHRPNLAPQIIYSPLLLNAITLGFGASAGAEGPTAYSCAAIASNLAQKFKLQERYIMILFGSGAAAGISAIFEAPIGGALFAIEILKISYSSFGLIVLFTTTVISALTTMTLNGHAIFDFPKIVNFVPSLTLWAILLGIVCGVYAIYYSYIFKFVEHRLNRLKNSWFKGITSGLLAGLAITYIPELYGEGYNTMNSLLNNSSPIAMLHSVVPIAICVILIKCFVASLCYNGGGVAGEFAPTLFAGCFVGYIFTAICNSWFNAELPLNQVATLGMVGVMAGVIRAPLMSIFIVVESTQSYSLILPIAIVSYASFSTVRLFTLDGFFEYHLDKNNGLLKFRNIISRLIHKKH